MSCRDKYTIIIIIIIKTSHNTGSGFPQNLQAAPMHHHKGMEHAKWF